MKNSVALRNSGRVEKVIPNQASFAAPAIGDQKLVLRKLMRASLASSLSLFFFNH